MDGTPTLSTSPPGLVYVSDRMPGIRRRRRGYGFSYLGPDLKPIADEKVRQRIRSLGIPPAYERVWICPHPDGHLQATGIDARGRKQYRYHPDWIAWRSTHKFSLLVPFGEMLSRLRDRLARDLESDPGERVFSLAALVTLLDRAQIRVGNPAHLRANGSHGATTLLRRHVTIEDGAVRLSYRAKGGRRVSQTLPDARLHRIFQEIDDLPGRRVFSFVSETGDVRDLGSHHVNAYLAEITGLEGVTAKTFRTWAGTVAAFEAAEKDPETASIRAVTTAAAARLHNTPAICRTSYVHPTVLDLTRLPARERVERLGAVQPAGPAKLRAPERRLLGFLAG